ncbi:Rho guanine nucleotide exchange factor [Marasmius sp. AFHP31]|nr:Rho guanine nucleotide exchange factor [Marasmius sp. AFHP31]
MSSTSSTTSSSTVAAPSRSTVFSPRPTTTLAITAKPGPTTQPPPTFSPSSLASFTTTPSLSASPPSSAPSSVTKCPLGKIRIPPVCKRVLHRNIDCDYDEILAGIRVDAPTRRSRRIAGPGRVTRSVKDNASNAQETNREAELLAKLEAAEKRYQALRDDLDSQAARVACVQDKVTNAHSDPDLPIPKRPRTRYEDDDKEEKACQGRKKRKWEGAGEAENTSTNDVMLRIQAFFGCVQRCQKVTRTQGEEAQRWLDLMQAVSPGLLYVTIYLQSDRLPSKLLDHISGLPEQSRSMIFHVILGLSKRSGLYPRCLTLENVDKLGEHPVAGGGFGDVWKGRVADQSVCLKVVRVFTESDVGQLVKVCVILDWYMTLWTYQDSGVHARSDRLAAT